MRKRTIGAIAGAGLALAAGAVGIGTAVAGGESEGSVTGPEADRAVAAALREAGGGTANSVERDSENGATWEVEVTRPDGSTVDVRLDAAYATVVVEGDDDGQEDGGDAGESG